MCGSCPSLDMGCPGLDMGCLAEWIWVVWLCGSELFGCVAAVQVLTWVVQVLTWVVWQSGSGLYGCVAAAALSSTLAKVL